MRKKTQCPCCDWRLRIAPKFDTYKGPIAALQRMRNRSRSSNSYAAFLFDHCYTTRRDGIVRYVSEPYGLDKDAIADLALLAQTGWNVSISANYARHYPGSTVAIEMTPPQSRCHDIRSINTKQERNHRP